MQLTVTLGLVLDVNTGVFGSPLSCKVALAKGVWRKGKAGLFTHSSLLT